MSSPHWFEPAPPEGRRLLSTIGARRVAVVAQSGGGKTYAVLRLLELLYEKGSPFVVIDPVGNFWGLRLAANGKSSGLDVRVLGGAHGDIELPAGSGKAIADFIAQTRASLILDISRLDDEERAKFVTDLARRLYERWSEKRRVLTLILDEAQEFVPETLEKKSDGPMRSVLRRWAHTGRNLGLGLILLTQAPQNVQKRVFNLADLLLVGRLGGEHERAAVERWVKRKGVNGKALLEDLPSLPSGTFYASSPEWLELADKVKVTDRITYDASRTPELGDEGHDEQALAAVDLGPLMKALRDCLPKEAEPPAAPRSRSASVGVATPAPGNGHALELSEVLQRELSEARAELARRQTVIDRLQQHNHELEEAARVAFERLRSVLAPTADRSAGAVVLTRPAPAAEPERRLQLDPLPPRVRELAGLPPLVERAMGRPAVVERPLRSTKPAPVAAPPATENDDESGSTMPYRQALLATICAYGPLNRERLSLLSGKSRTSTTFASAIRWLVAAQLITDDAGRLEATPEGHRQDRTPPLPIGRALYDHWRSKLTPYDAETMDAIAKYRGGLTRKQLSEVTGHSLTSTTFASSIRTLKAMGLAGEVGGRVLLLDHVRTSMGLS